jgi:trehalose 2-sulfotransferase
MICLTTRWRDAASARFDVRYRSGAPLSSQPLGAQAKKIIEAIFMKPHTSYIICAVQRSGSFLLCEALKNTRLAGFPEEYFLDGQGWEDGEWARQNGVITRSDYLWLVFEKGTSPNGVFGAKIMWNYFPIMLQKLTELPKYRGWNAPELMADLFPNLHYIWIVRGDKVRQAVSWAKAGADEHLCLAQR